MSKRRRHNETVNPEVTEVIDENEILEDDQEVEDVKEKKTKQKFGEKHPKLAKGLKVGGIILGAAAAGAGLDRLAGKIPFRRSRSTGIEDSSLNNSVPDTSDDVTTTDNVTE